MQHLSISAAPCGGIHCVGKYVYDHGLTRNTDITVNTLAGVKRLALHADGGRVDSVTVDMGAPYIVQRACRIRCP